MRLFGYIVVFAYDFRDDERTIWHHARWGRGGLQCEAHARWGRGGLTVAACHCCGPAGGRGDPSPTWPHCYGPTGGRGGPSPPPPCHSPTIGPHCCGPAGGRSPIAPLL
jgi:hypothetical protein